MRKKKSIPNLPINRDRLKTAVIVPAYNEEQRIAPVLKAVTSAALVDEVIVVSDASFDRTAEIARGFNEIKVIELPFNLGKGGAMAAGVAATKAPVIAFVDADLAGFQADHLDTIIRPILDGSCDMCIGVFRGGKFWSDTAQKITPYISGQRALRREIFESIPFLEDLRMGIEVTINTYAKRQKARVARVVLRGVSNTHKERKMGLVKGAAARAKMYTEIGRAMVRSRRRTKLHGRFRIK